MQKSLVIEAYSMRCFSAQFITGFKMHHDTKLLYIYIYTHKIYTEKK